MLKVAYIVSAYKLPGLLERLLRRLAAPGASFTVHVDRKTPSRTYSEMVARTRDLDVTFLPRHVCHWGGFGHVEASLKGIERLLRDRVPFDYVVLLTGQDYPLRSPSEIAARLESAQGRSFMSHWQLPYEPWGARGGLDRIERWHLVAHRRIRLSLPLRRRLPNGLVAYGGSPYWCLARPVVEYVHQVVREDASFVRFFKHVFVPDELFFQTIVMNSPLRQSVVNDNARYIVWSRRPAPAILRRSDLEAMQRSGKLFARKFDPTVDAEVLDALDAWIDRRERAG